MTDKYSDLRSILSDRPVLVDGAEITSLLSDLDAANARAEKYRTRKNEAFTERNRLVALLARLVLAAGGVAGKRKHEPDPDPNWAPDWLTLVQIDLPTGQVSWHFHDSDAHLVADLPEYVTSWDGHDTAEKYRRVLACRALSDVRAESAERERDDLSAKLDAMTNQAVMLSSRRAVIVDVSASDEVEALRAELEKVERERDEALAYANRKCHRIDHAASITTCLSCADCQRERAEKAEQALADVRTTLADYSEIVVAEGGGPENVAASVAVVCSRRLRAQDALAALEAEVKRLREMVPSESILRLMDHAFARGEVALNIGERQAVKDAITRLDAARGGL